MININKYYNPNRRIEPKEKKDWKMKYPEFCISQLPGVGVVNVNDIKPGVHNAFDYIDDNYIVKDVSDSKKIELYWAWGFVGVYFFLMLINLSLIGFGKNLLIIGFILGLIFIPPSIWFFYKALTRPKKSLHVNDLIRR